MKKFFFIAGLVLLFAACSNESENMVINAQMEKATAPVMVRVSGFSVSQEAFATPRRAAEDVADYADVKAIDLAFYSGETEVYKTTQVRGQGGYTTFGEFSCNLPIGNYTMVVVGRGWYDGDVFTLTSPTAAGYTSERARETFCATQAVNIANTNAVNLNATLNRIIAKVQVVSTDNRVAGVSKVRTTYSAGGKSFNPTTGLATSNTGFAVTNTPSAAVGSTVDLGSYVFLATDAQTMDITLEVLDENEDVMFTKFVANVPLQRNKKTILTGPLFNSTAVASSAFQLETEWLTDHNVNF